MKFKVIRSLVISVEVGGVLAAPSGWRGDAPVVGRGGECVEGRCGDAGVGRVDGQLREGR